MLNKDRAILVVVDIQDVLLPKSTEVAASYLRLSEKLIRVARTLNIPVVATEQYPERLGHTNTAILEALGNTPVLSKLEFGCLANQGFRETLENSGRRQLIIIGMETHVCVMQTALEAIGQGYEIYIVRDAVVSARKTDYKAGLARMAQAGAVCVSTEMAIFELLRQAGTPEFKQVLPLIKS
jgi:nicotinamidase-related amidase